ncbi:uncharacterized protein LOC113859477 [Abrus precatorius]|uniref:Uncharacterized protein LOC113859477 n=1 Tax=Abrus precatorius TaxID=3816 RepID=A0A8B8KXG5_ABRPR|nr:uncharacterized protein LOC113859477 [Abrus precatorius]
MDRVVTANEIIDDARKRRRRCAIFKVDFRKAYDSVCWEYLLGNMARMSFCQKWCIWVEMCLKSALVSVLVNGSPTKQFQMEKGIRQEDLMSPFLFLIVAEGLSLLIDKVVQEGAYVGFSVGDGGIYVLMLQFADDTMFFFEDSEENITTLKCVLRMFELALGLQINFDKKIYKRSWDSRSIETCLLEVDCIQDSNEGRWCGLHGKKVCQAKEVGELGIKNLGAMNRALLGKWRWRLLNEEGELWYKVLKAKYYVGGSEVWRKGRHVSEWWREIWRVDEGGRSHNGWLGKLFRIRTGNGGKTTFWHDVWSGDQPLKQVYLRLFRLSLQQGDLINTMGACNEIGYWSWNWYWSRPMIDREERMRLEMVESFSNFSLLQNVKITGGGMVTHQGNIQSRKRTP